MYNSMEKRRWLNQCVMPAEACPRAIGGAGIQSHRILLPAAGSADSRLRGSTQGAEIGEEQYMGIKPRHSFPYQPPRGRQVALRRSFRPMNWECRLDMCAKCGDGPHFAPRPETGPNRAWKEQTASPSPVYGALLRSAGSSSPRGPLRRRTLWNKPAIDAPAVCDQRRLPARFRSA